MAHAQLGRHADELAYRVRDIFRAAGYPMLFDSSTNQQFPHSARCRLCSTRATPRG